MGHLIVNSQVICRSADVVKISVDELKIENEMPFTRDRDQWEAYPLRVASASPDAGTALDDDGSVTVNVLLSRSQIR